MFGQAPRGSLAAVAYPQQSTTGHGAVREKEEHFPRCRCSNLQIPNAHEEGVMRLPVDRQSSPLPKRFPVGARYVVEGRGGEDGNLRVVSRYVVLPGGQRINVPSDPGQPPGLSAHAPRHKRARNRARSPRIATKKIMQKAGTTRQHQH